MKTSAIDVHADVTRKDLHELVAELIGALGVTVVQAITGTKDRTQPRKWARIDGPKPRREAEERLRLAYRMWSFVERNESPSVALTWMVGANPMLDERTPVTAIRELDAVAVTQAAQAFVEDVLAS